MLMSNVLILGANGQIARFAIDSYRGSHTHASSIQHRVSPFPEFFKGYTELLKVYPEIHRGNFSTRYSVSL